MSRARNPAHRDALLAAATRLIATQGLAATTATIAKEAGVSAGTLFVYFETKPALLNELYVSLKSEMGRVATKDLQTIDTTPHEQLRHLWNHWVGWSTEAPEKRRALAQLDVAEDITDESRDALHRAFANTAVILERCRVGGPMQDAPPEFAFRIIKAIADATIDDLIAQPAPGRPTDDPRSSLGFDATWRALAG